MLETGYGPDTGPTSTTTEAQRNKMVCGEDVQLFSNKVESLLCEI